MLEDPAAVGDPHRLDGEAKLGFGNERDYVLGLVQEFEHGRAPLQAGFANQRNLLVEGEVLERRGGSALVFARQHEDLLRARNFTEGG